MVLQFYLTICLRSVCINTEDKGESMLAMKLEKSTDRREAAGASETIEV